MYDPKLIVRDTLPAVTQNTPFVPTFRYLREAGLIAADGTIDMSNLHARVRRTAAFEQVNYHPPKAYRREEQHVVELGSVDEVIRHYKENACLFFALLRREQIDTDVLRKYILTNLKSIASKKSNIQTYFRRLVCFYDWLAYR